LNADESSIADSSFNFLREPVRPQRDPSPDYPILDNASTVKISFLDEETGIP